MATRQKKAEWQDGAQKLRGALPSREHIAKIICEQGYGLDWEMIPAALKDLLNKSAHKNVLSVAGLFAKEPEVLEKTAAAKL